MDIESLFEQNNIDKWHEFRPSDSQYLRYYEKDSNLILAGLKIADIYEQFSFARASLRYLEVNDYGELIAKHDEMHLLYIRSKFLFDALALYNYCIDLSWQFVYLFCGAANKDVAFDESYYLQSTKECDLETLKGRVVLVCKLPDLYKKVELFFNSEITNDIRKSYNYIKHRGTYHIEGLGLNDTHLMMSIDGKKIPIISRESINIDNFKNKLLKFDEAYYNYFNDLIKETMPQDFVSNKISFLDYINLGMNYKD